MIRVTFKAPDGTRYNRAVMTDPEGLVVQLGCTINALGEPKRPVVVHADFMKYHGFFKQLTTWSRLHLVLTESSVNDFFELTCMHAQLIHLHTLMVCAPAGDSISVNPSVLAVLVDCLGAVNLETLIVDESVRDTSGGRMLLSSLRAELPSVHTIVC